VPRGTGKLLDVKNPGPVEHGGESFRNIAAALPDHRGVRSKRNEPRIGHQWMTRTVKDRSPLRRDFLRLLVLPARQVPVFSRIDNLYLDEPERNEHKKKEKRGFHGKDAAIPLLYG
jgi:hypothetical protein